MAALAPDWRTGSSTWPGLQVRRPGRGDGPPGQGHPCLMETAPPWPGRAHWSMCPTSPSNGLLSPNLSPAPAGKHLAFLLCRWGN